MSTESNAPASTEEKTQSCVRKQTGPWDWEEVDVLVYKENPGTHFKSITRRVLFEGVEDLSAQLRYFEMAEDGYSTLERHEHVHSVMIFRGKGQCMVQGEVHDVAAGDLVYVPPLTWHQFRANKGETMGFLCLVNCSRDRPQLPTEEELAELRSNPKIGDFIRY